MSTKAADSARPKKSAEITAGYEKNLQKGGTS